MFFSIIIDCYHIFSQEQLNSIERFCFQIQLNHFFDGKYSKNVKNQFDQKLLKKFFRLNMFKENNFSGLCNIYHP